MDCWTTELRYMSILPHPLYRSLRLHSDNTDKEFLGDSPSRKATCTQSFVLILSSLLTSTCYRHLDVSTDDMTFKVKI